MLNMITGQGRYGTVWMGYLENQQVAIKVFPASYKSYYFNERDIYSLPFMDNPCLLTYYGRYILELNVFLQMYLKVISRSLRA